MSSTFPICLWRSLLWPSTSTRARRARSWTRRPRVTIPPTFRPFPSSRGWGRPEREAASALAPGSASAMVPHPATRVPGTFRNFHRRCMSETITISVDAMGGDHAPRVPLHGAKLLLRERPDARFIFHGRQEVLTPLLDEFPELRPVSTIRHADIAIAMDDKPSQALRKGRGT